MPTAPPPAPGSPARRPGPGTRIRARTVWALVGLAGLATFDLSRLGEPWPAPLDALSLVVVLVGVVAIALGARTAGSRSGSAVRTGSPRAVLRPAVLRPAMLSAATLRTVTALGSVALTGLLVLVHRHGAGTPGPASAGTLDESGSAPVSLAEAAVLLALVWVGARAADRPRAAVPALLAGVAFVGLTLRTSQTWDDVSTTALGLLVMLLVVASLGGYAGLTARRRDAAVDASLRAERLSLAADLHDLVAHHVTAVVLQTRMAQVLVDEDPAAAREVLLVAESEAERALDSMRAVVGVLRHGDGQRDPAPVLADLVGLVERFSAVGPRARLEMPTGDLAQVPDAVQTAVFRVVQEALTNAREHGDQVSEVVVRVERSGRGVLATVTDDGTLPLPAEADLGPGPTPDLAAVSGTSGLPAAGPPVALHDSVGTNRGLGLLGMRERVGALGGDLVAGPRVDGSGWQVQVTLGSSPGTPSTPGTPGSHRTTS